MSGQERRATRARTHATAARSLDKSAAAIEAGHDVVRGVRDPETLRKMAREHRLRAGNAVDDHQA